MDDTLIILNPAARSERARRFHAQIESLTRGKAALCATSCMGEAEILARRAAQEGYDRVVAAGGDGTINEVVNGLAGSSTALGLLPMGTMNVFATELGLPASDLNACWEIIRSGYARSVDLPSANGKRFVQLAGIGLDAQAVKETSLALKRNFGPLSYIISAAQIASRPSPHLTVTAEGLPPIEGSFVLVGNGRLYGGPFPFFKRASIEDGLLDVLVFRRISYLEIIRYLQDVIFSAAINRPDVEYVQTNHLRVEAVEDVPIEVDGELVGNCPVEFTVQERGLRVLSPR